MEHDYTWEIWLLLTCLALFAIAGCSWLWDWYVARSRDYYRVFMRDQAAKRDWRKMMESKR